ncbi:MAG TPA: hypothetical protein VIU38_06565 [Anaerolineales bacterium]
MNLGAELQRALAPDQRELLRLAAGQAAAMNLHLFAVGGLPRDLILGRPAGDLDVVVEGDAIELARMLQHNHGGRLIVHPKFGTATWKRDAKGGATAVQAPGAHLDLISARAETYAGPAQLPRVKPGTIQDDLRRRDFTMNAVAIDLDASNFGDTLDPLGGIADIRTGVIRVLHGGSFEDDPTRMFRAVRYEHRLGFHMDRRTLRLVPKARGLIADVSAARIRHELALLLMEDHAGKAIHRLGQLGLLGAAHRALPYGRLVVNRLNSDTRVIADSASPETEDPHTRRWLLWLMDLSAAQIRSVDRRLHFDGRLLGLLLAASSLRRRLRQLTDAPPSKAVRVLDPLPLPAIDAVSRASRSGAPGRALQKYIMDWRHVRPHTTAADLRRLGLVPGPIYAEILTELRAKRLDGVLRDAAEEKAFLDERLRGRKSP